MESAMCLRLIFLIILLTLVYSKPTKRISDGTESPGNFYRIDDMLIPINRANRAGQAKTSYRWPLGRIPFTFGPGFSDDEMREVYFTMKYIEKYTCIRFGFRDEENEEEDYLYIRNIDGKCQSFIGNIQRGPQQVALDPESKSCAHPNFPGHILHELIHAIGFYHEHSRDDRDNYIEILYENLPDDSAILRNFLTASEADKTTAYYGVPYNYDSIMHYSQKAGSLNGEPTIIKKEPLPNDVPEPFDGVMGQRVRLSKGDVMMIRNMYKDYCPVSTRSSSHNSLRNSYPEVDEWVYDVDQGDEIAFPVEEIYEEDDDDDDYYTYFYDESNTNSKSPRRPKTKVESKTIRVTKGKRKRKAHFKT